MSDESEQVRAMRQAMAQRNIRPVVSVGLKGSGADMELDTEALHILSGLLKVRLPQGDGTYAPAACEVSGVLRALSHVLTAMCTEDQRRLHEAVGMRQGKVFPVGG